jgi:hypothetical protein
MFVAFRSSYARLPDISGIWLRIGGLGNNDTRQSDVDSIEIHGMMKPFYERLLVEWEQSADQENLTREDFLRIQPAIETLDTVSAASHTGRIVGALGGLISHFGSL